MMGFFDFLLGADGDFKPWPRIEPQHVTRPVPSWIQPPGPIGSADRVQNTFGAPLPPSCAIYEGAELVGYRTACGGE